MIKKNMSCIDIMGNICMFKKYLPLSIISILIISSLQGCSIGRVFGGPPPVDVDRVKVGVHRNIVISVLGPPKVTESKSQQKMDIYEFVDGHSSGSKIRAILYIAGDILTLGLSELLFWPIELAAGYGTSGRAIVTYGADDIANHILLSQTNGSPWEYKKNEIPEQSTQ